MKATLMIEYADRDDEFDITITQQQWQQYQQDRLQFGDICDLSLTGANDWSLTLEQQG